MTSTPSVCPSCLEQRAASGDCRCDATGIAPDTDAARARAGRRRLEVLTTLTPHTPGPATVGQRPAVPASAFADVLDGTLTAGECGSCNAPSPDTHLCETCRDTIAVELARIPDVIEDLNGIRFGLRGIDYRRRGTGGSGAPTKHQPLPITAHAVDARDTLRRTLRHLVETCLQLDVANLSPHRTIPPRGDIPAMAEWLRWRVDGMAAFPHFTDTPAALRSAVGLAAYVAMPAEARRAIGPCPLAESHACPGVVMTTPGDDTGRCTECGEIADTGTQITTAVDQVREDRMTAADIARLALYLVPAGSTVEPRDRIRMRLHHWADRGTLTRRVSLDRHQPGPVFRVGDALDLLDSHRTHPRHRWTPWTPAAHNGLDELGQPPHLARWCTDDRCDAYETKRNRDHAHTWGPWLPEPGAVPARVGRRCTVAGCTAHPTRPAASTGATA